MIHHIQVKNMDAGVMRNQLIRFFILILLCACHANDTVESFDSLDFLDGLNFAPDQTETFDLPDKYGVNKIETFYVDINNNGKHDIIKRGRFETGTAHAYTFYEIYLDSSELIANLKTLESADCILTAYKFNFNPFSIIMATRPLGQDYTEPTNATLETIIIQDNKLETISTQRATKICDVRNLLL